MGRKKREEGEYYCPNCTCIRRKEPCKMCIRRKRRCDGTCDCCQEYREEKARKAARDAAIAANSIDVETSGTLSSTVQASVSAQSSRSLPEGTIQPSLVGPGTLNENTNLPSTSSSHSASEVRGLFPNKIKHRWNSSEPDPKAIIHECRRGRRDGQTPSTSGSCPLKNQGSSTSNATVVYAVTFSYVIRGQMQRLFIGDGCARVEDVPAYVYIYENRELVHIMTGECYYANWCLNCKGLRNWIACRFCRDDPKSCKMVCSCNNPEYRTQEEIGRVRADDTESLGELAACGAQFLQSTQEAIRDANLSPILPSETELEPINAVCQRCKGERLAPRLCGDIFTLLCIMCYHEVSLPVMRTLEGRRQAHSPPQRSAAGFGNEVSFSATCPSPLPQPINPTRHSGLPEPRILPGHSQLSQPHIPVRHRGLPQHVNEPRHRTLAQPLPKPRIHCQVVDISRVRMKVLHLVAF